MWKLGLRLQQQLWTSPLAQLLRQEHGRLVYYYFFLRKLFQSIRLYIKGIVRRSASKCAWQ